MSLLIDTRYADYASSRLEGFKWVRPGLGNCRCPFCGDSSKKANKKRFYFYRKTTGVGADPDALKAFCHNCNYSKPFGMFLKEFDAGLYDKYRLEAYKERSAWSAFIAKPKEEAKPAVKPTFFRGAPPMSVRVDRLPEDHFCRLYVESRKIEQMDLLYFSEDFKQTVKVFRPDFEEKVASEPRLIIPFFDEEKNLTCLQGRHFGDDTDNRVRYLTIKKDDDSSKVFGLERVNKARTVAVVEGPLDSLFIPNCVATADSNLLSIDWAGLYIPDHQYRNVQVCKLIDRIIDAGKKVVLFPEELVWKDINDMVSKGGMSKADLFGLIAANAYSGLTAKNVFSKLRKV